MKALLNGKKITKWGIACEIENLDKNTPWSQASNMTLFCDYYKLEELVELYNKYVITRNLKKPLMIYIP